MDIEVPRLHDVGDILLAHQDRLPEPIQKEIKKMAEISHRMRLDREMAFYCSEDLTPTEFYKDKDAKSALKDATFIVDHLRSTLS